MKTHFFLFLLATLCIGSFSQQTPIQTENTNCTTPDGNFGTCINVKECPPLLELLKESRNKQDSVDFLRKSLCRYENKDAIVCCPSNQSESTSYNAGSYYFTKNNDSEDIRPSNSTSAKVYELPSPPDCGNSNVSQSKIVDGPAEIGAWPWVAALGYGNKTKHRWLCGGTLITSRHVITPAHCVTQPRLKVFMVRFGQVHLNRNETEEEKPTDVLVEKIFVHAWYSNRNKINDIALIILQSDVTFSGTIRPICLPHSNEMRQMLFVRNFPVVAGWGSTQSDATRNPEGQSLLQLQVPVVDNDVCSRIYKEILAIEPTHLCAGFLRGGKGTCQGDAGGPLMWTKNGTFYLIGVVSLGPNKCGEPGYPGIYPRITSYIQWIIDTIRSEESEVTTL